MWVLFTDGVSATLWQGCFPLEIHFWINVKPCSKRSDHTQTVGESLPGELRCVHPEVGFSVMSFLPVVVEVKSGLDVCPFPKPSVALHNLGLMSKEPNTKTLLRECKWLAPTIASSVAPLGMSLPLDPLMLFHLQEQEKSTRVGPRLHNPFSVLDEEFPHEDQTTAPVPYADRIAKEAYQLHMASPET